MRRLIEEKPLLVIAAWIIVALALAPLAASLDKYVKTEEKEFLPETAESRRAMEEAEKLGGNSGYGFIAAVQGVEVSPESYRGLREWYLGFKSQAENRGVEAYTWLDVALALEENLTARAREALERILPLANATIAMHEAYQNLTSQSLHLAQLVEAADLAYTGYWRAAQGVAAAKPLLDQELAALNATCNAAVPAMATLYYDVVRAEVALEEAGAYQRGLDNETLAYVENWTGQGPRGPVDPAIVALVYQAVASSGGPGAFNNTLAARIAGEALAQSIPSGLVANATIAAWTSIVARAPDHASLLREQGPSAQAVLYQEVLRLIPQARTAAAEIVKEALVQAAPQAQGLVEALAQTITGANCTISDPLEAEVEAASNFLAGQGIPEPVAGELARLALTGGLDHEGVALLAAQTVAEQANATGLAQPLAMVLVKIDPEARDNLTQDELAKAGAYLLALVLNVPEPEAILGAGSPGEAVLALLQQLVAMERGEEAAALAQRLYQEGVLQAGDGEFPAKAREAIAGVLVEQGVPGDAAGMIAEAGLRVAMGESTLDSEVEALAGEWLDQALPELIDELKGKLVSKTGDGFLILFNVDEPSLEERVEVAEWVRGRVESGLNARVILGGPDYTSYVMREAALEDVKRSDRVSMVFVIIILGLLLESVVAVFLPFTGIGLGLLASLAVAALLASRGVIDVTTFSRSVMFTTGLGLGIDYAAYVSKRFRDAAAQGLDPRRAAGKAFQDSIRPVAAGAATAMIGFGSMLLAWDLPFVRSIGSNVPLTIAAVALASLTFIPALLALVGGKRWFWWPKGSNRSGEPRLRGLARASTRRPAAMLLILVLLAGLAVYGAASFEGSHDPASFLPRDSEPVRLLEILKSDYEPGVLYPIVIVASSEEKASDIAGAIEGLDCVAHASVEGRLVSVTLDIYPMSEEGLDCTREIRALAHRVDPGSLVGGYPAVDLDLQEAINKSFYHRVYPASLVLMTLTLLAAYGSLALALAAVAGVVVAAYAATAIAGGVMQAMGVPVPWYLPVIVFTAILGVGMDYNSFYLAHAREECMKKCSRDAVEEATARAAGLVLGLATIMAGAYLGIAIAETPSLQAMGAALLLGVLLAGASAAVITLPPLQAILGAKAWWPLKPGRRE